VSTTGSAALAYNDTAGLEVASCTAGCASTSAWTPTMLERPSTIPESLAYGPDEGLQLVAQVPGDSQSLLFIDCPANCSAMQSWGGFYGLWTATGDLQAQLARTASGGTRVAVYGVDPGTPLGERAFTMLSCETACAVQSSWLTPMTLPVAAGSAEVGFTLVLDAADNPLLATAAATSSAISSCSEACTSSAGQWLTTPNLTSELLDAAFPIAPPPTCEWAGWSLYAGPALALVGGRPITGITASAEAFGGQCARSVGEAQTTSFDKVSFLTFGP